MGDTNTGCGSGDDKSVANEVGNLPTVPISVEKTAAVIRAPLVNHVRQFLRHVVGVIH